MRVLLLLAALLAVPAGNSVSASAKARTLELLPVGNLTLVGARAEAVDYKGQRAVHLQSRLGHEADDDSMLAIIPESDFKDGVIELDVAGAPIPQVPAARGTKARLYVNHATQPTLIVNDLKLGDTHGAIALWSHTFTDGYFANLRVK